MGEFCRNGFGCRGAGNGDGDGVFVRVSGEIQECWDSVGFCWSGYRTPVGTRDAFVVTLDAYGFVSVEPE